jgi:hypothetical protein
MFPALVLEQDRAYTQALVGFDSTDDAFRIAVTIVAVGDERQVGGGSNIANAVGHLSERSQTEIRQRVARCKERRSPDRERAKTGTLDQSRGQCIVRERRYQRPLGAHRLAQRRSFHAPPFNIASVRGESRNAQILTADG